MDQRSSRSRRLSVKLFRGAEQHHGRTIGSAGKSRASGGKSSRASREADGR